MKRNPDPRNRQSGTAAVEFALVLPIFLILVLGAIDWGWFFFIDQVVTNSAREGARAGSVLAPTTPSGTAVTAAEKASEDFLKAANFTNLLPKRVSASVTTVDGTDAIKVIVTYPAGSLTGLLSNVMPANAKATAMMRWQ